MALEFVEDWTIAQTLGEGAYGEVKLLVNKVTGDSVAMKMIDLERGQDINEAVRKEVAIHRTLQHPHVVRYYGRRQHASVEYLFLEYASHGELFDRIEPDVGMSQWEAQKYFKQLMSGVQYLHSRGVAHRDLKPENLLLDENDNIKITDFGMATIFRIGGKERALDKRCGTLPYVGPEVLARPYAAEPADVWSCGIVLVAMLAGELPWDEASPNCADFLAWSKGKYMQLSPWCKLDTLALALLRRILTPLPSARYTVACCLQHKWSTIKFHPDDPPVHYEGGLRKRQAMMEVEGGELCLSQPATTMGSSRLEEVKEEKEDAICANSNSFSQPSLITDLLISTQQIFTQSPSTQNSLQKLVRRMTRFFLKMSVEEAIKELGLTLDKLNLPWKCFPPGPLTITTMDRRKTVLVFKACALEMEDLTLIDFRLSKGCGLEFKKHFLTIRTSLGYAIVPPPSLV